ncbi:MAG: transcriptional repressor [Bacilli bacterium]
MNYSIQRNLILEEVKNRCDHPTAEIIYESIKLKLPNISLGTVYRNLSKLSDLDLINRVTIPNSKDRFDKTLLHHSHFICSNCGIVYDLFEIDNKSIINTIEKTKEYNVKDLSLTVSGTCAKCT